jgi:hypothetical protein
VVPENLGQLGMERVLPRGSLVLGDLAYLSPGVLSLNADDTLCFVDVLRNRSGATAGGERRDA